MQRRMGLVAAMESGEVKLDYSGNEQTELETALVSDLIALNTSEAECAGLEAENKVSVAAVTVLENIALALEASLLTGGLNQAGAQVLEISLEHLYSQVGVRVSQVLPALESFNQPGKRVTSTSIALEETKGVIRKVWDAIVAAIRKSIAWVQEHFTKVFGKANLLERRAKALLKLARAPRGSQKAKTFENPHLTRSLYIAGTVPSIMAGPTHKLKAITGAVFALNSKFGEAIATAMEVGDPGKFMLVMMEEAINGSDLAKMLTDVTNPAGDGLTPRGTDVKLMRSIEMFGGKAIIANVPKGDITTLSLDDQVRILNEVTTHVGPFKPSLNAPDNKTLPVLTISDTVTVSELVAEIAVAVQQYRQGIDRCTKIKERIAKAVEKLGTDNATETDVTKSDSIKYMQKIGSTLPRMLDQPQSSFAVYVLATGTALLDYVELSLKQYAKA